MKEKVEILFKNYAVEENEYSDILKEPQIEMFFENGSSERNEDGMTALALRGFHFNSNTENCPSRSSI